MKNLSGGEATGKREWWWEAEGKSTKLNLGVTPQSDDKKKGEIITFLPTKKSILFETDWPDKYKTDFYKILEE